IARRPIRPTAFTWPAPAIPATSVPKMSGAMIILISRRKIWLNGLKYCAQSGCVRDTIAPAAMPSTRPRRICVVSVRPRLAWGAGVVAEDMDGDCTRSVTMDIYMGTHILSPVDATRDVLDAVR